MVKRYIRFSMPIEANNLLNQKKISMEKTIKDLTGKTRTIPKTRLITQILRKSVFFENNEITKMSRRKSA